MTPRNKENKKGQVEIQFNWIFILIAGAIILTFFVTIALSQKKAAETQTEATFFLNFDKAISGISATEGHTISFDIPNLAVRYDCTLQCDCAAYTGVVRGTTNLYHFRNREIFSPNYLKGNSILAHSEQWAYPFAITNFFYMTSPEMKYFIEDTPDGRGQALFDELPPTSIIDSNNVPRKAMDKQMFNVTQLQTMPLKGFYKVKFIFLSTDPTTITIPADLASLDATDVTAILINPDSTQISFYQKGTGASNQNKFISKGDSYLFGNATEFAGVFSDDAVSYNCMLNDAFKTLSMVSAVIAEKENQYKAIAPDCAAFYQGQAALINSFSAGLDFNSQSIDNNKIVEIRNNAEALTIQNKNMLQNNCPNLY